MIKLELVELDSDDWKTWRQECQSERDAVIERVRNGEDAQLSNLYKDLRMQAVYKDDGPPFYGKCAYCEGQIHNSGDIDHYRPRRAVEDEDGNRVMVNSNGEERVPHPGYYWLAYEWSNLLYACSDCNRINKEKAWRRPSRQRGVVPGGWRTCNRTGRRSK